MIVHFDDGTHEYINNLEKLKWVLVERLGKDVVSCLEEFFSNEIEKEFEENCNACGRVEPE